MIHTNYSSLLRKHLLEFTWMLLSSFSILCSNVQFLGRHVKVRFVPHCFALAKWMFLNSLFPTLRRQLAVILQIFDKIKIFYLLSYLELRLTHLFFHLKSGTLKSIPYVSCVGDSWRWIRDSVTEEDWVLSLHCVCSAKSRLPFKGHALKTKALSK